MRRQLARILRRLANKLHRPQPEWPGPDPRLTVLGQQTDAIKGVASVLEGQVAKGIPEAVNTISARLIGPQIARSISETRAIGASDSEILDTLSERLAEGWW